MFSALRPAVSSKMEIQSVRATRSSVSAGETPAAYAPPPSAPPPPSTSPMRGRATASAHAASAAAARRSAAALRLQREGREARVPIIVVLVLDALEPPDDRVRER